MVLGIGVDVIRSFRFKKWKDYSLDKLLKVFSQRELEELNNSFGDKVDFFATRFASKEAFYKALSYALVALGYTQKTFSFAFARKHIEVLKGKWDLPVLEINWRAFEEKIGQDLPKIKPSLSFSHEKEYSVAVVVLESV